MPETIPQLARTSHRFPTAAAWLAASLVIFSSLSGEANLRAPRVIPQSPSSTLFKAHPDLTVQYEKLFFTCDASCLVNAVYVVESAAAGDFSFEFILPVRSEVGVQLQGQEVALHVTAAEPLKQNETKLDLADRNLSDGSVQVPTPLYRANFRATLASGRNQIEISYNQLLGAHESSYGYFRKGREVRKFQYEVWPLTEWQRAENFHLDLMVRLKRKAPGWWKRQFGTVQSIVCEANTQGRSHVDVLRQALSQQNGDYLEYTAVLGDLPERLFCYLGDEDILPK